MPRPCKGRCLYDPTETVKWCAKCFWKPLEKKHAQEYLKADIVEEFAALLAERRTIQYPPAGEPAATAWT
jgi:hypothetical protein